MPRWRRLLLALAVVAVALWTAPASQGGEWSASGSAALEMRSFFESPALDEQEDGLQSSATFEPELRWRSEDGRHRVTIVGFGRWDEVDAERRHVDLREASYLYLGDRVELLAGVSKVFWGVAESRHLVDVVNQADAVEDVDEEDRLGQPMLRLAAERGWGRLELYALLGFRERTFPGVAGRLRPPLPVAEEARYESSAGDERIDAALRWTRAIGDWDVGAHLFHGTGREPLLRPDAAGRRLLPDYRLTTQGGADVQYTRGAWLWKAEALVREGHGKTFGAVTAGFERTVFQVVSSPADLGLLLELHWDGRDRKAPQTPFDGDTFLGLRLAFNDVQGSELLAGAIVDHDDGSVFALVEAARRLGGRFTVEVEARLFSAQAPQGDLAALERDDFFALRIGRHW